MVDAIAGHEQALSATLLFISIECKKWMYSNKEERIIEQSIPGCNVVCVVCVCHYESSKPNGKCGLRIIILKVKVKNKRASGIAIS